MATKIDLQINDGIRLPGRFSLRARLLLLIIGVASTLVIVLLSLGFHAVRTVSKTAQAVSQNALETQANRLVTRLTQQNAKRNAAVLDQTMIKAELLATAASKYLSDPKPYAQIGEAKYSLSVQLLPDGQIQDGPQELASIFVPNTTVMTSEIEQTLVAGRMLDEMARTILDSNANTAAVYVTTPKDVTRYYPKGGLNDLPPDFKITEHALFKDVAPKENPTGKSLWSRVYNDPANLGLLVTATVPLYADSGDFLGIAGVDFRLSDLENVLEEEMQSDDSYAFLIDDAGKAIALPDRAYRDFLKRPRGDQEFGTDLSELKGDISKAIKSMRSGERGVVRIQDQGLDKYLSYAPLGKQGWSLATVVDANVILSELNKLETTLASDTKTLALKFLIPLGLIILCVVTGIAFALTYRFTAPLRELTKAAEAIGRQEWDTPMPIAGGDEIGVLSRTLRGVAQHLKALIEELELRVRDRTGELSSALVRVESSNKQLSEQIEERQRADSEKRDIELRFKGAFHSAPVGMALMDAKGNVINPNPHMKSLFWPDLQEDQTALLEPVIAEMDKARFLKFTQDLSGPMKSTISAGFDCLANDGSERHVVFYFSKIDRTETQDSYIVLLAQDVTQTEKLTKQLRYQANHDELTGLKNRRAFDELLTRRISGNNGNKISPHLLIMDLDKFKIVNDTCGHAEGDRLLIEISKLISNCVRPDDVVSRLGGDEFAVLLSDCAQDIAVRRAEEICAAVAQYEFCSAGDVFKVGISIGLVTADIGDIDFVELQRKADAACYAAKNAGRNCVHIAMPSVPLIDTGSSFLADEHRGK